MPALAAERPVTWPKRTRAQALERARSGSRGIAYDSEISRRTVFPLPEMPLVVDRAPALAEMTATVVRTGTAKRASRQIEEDLRRHWRGSWHRAPARTPAPFRLPGSANLPSRCCNWSNELAREASFPEGEFERERRQKLEEVKLERTAPGFPGRRALAQSVVWRAPVRAGFAERSAGCGVQARGSAVRLPPVLHARKRLADAGGRFRAASDAEDIEKVFGAWTGKEAGGEANCRAAAIRAGAAFIWCTFPARCRRKFSPVATPSRGSIRTGCKLGLTNSLYGGAFNSRLVMNIREDKGYTYSPRSSVNPLRQHGYFSVSAAVRNEVVAASLTEIFYEMDKLRSLPVPEAELADAQNYLSGVFSMGLATQDGLLSQISTVALNELPDDYLETYRAESARADAGRFAGNRAQIFRFREHADRGRRRPRANRIASRAVRRPRSLRRTGQDSWLACADHADNY